MPEPTLADEPVVVSIAYDGKTGDYTMTFTFEDRTLVSTIEKAKLSVLGLGCTLYDGMVAIKRGNAGVRNA